MNADADPSSVGAQLSGKSAGEQLFVPRFLQVCDEHASRPCVIESGSRVYTYRQMWQRAGAIASELRRRGAGKEAVVGLCLDKSFDYVASFIGAWLAGAAFMPLDAALPRERLSRMIEESGARIVVAQPKTAPLFHDLDVSVLVPDLETKAQPEVSPASVNADDLAYVIFTSGSTGTAKGVLVEHRGIVNFLDAQIAAFRLTPESRALFYLSTAFDASISDMGTALLSGAALLIEPTIASSTPLEFQRIIAERAITHMDIPPSLLKMLDCEGMPRSLATVIIGGEACAPDIVRRWAAKVRLVNVYGPTESTVCTSLGVCHAQTWERPLIGVPIAGVTYHILGDRLEEVADGAPGELYIGGIALARGYLNRPELNQQKFLTSNGMRLYRTGDLVCRLETGDIEFLGRTDRQVKVRGMLVAPEEVETRLQEHPLVARAAVLTRPWSPAVSGREVLIAFVTGRGADYRPDARSLRDHLAKRLPRWMLPQHYEYLDEMPLTVTGKVDLGALKQLPLSRRARDNASAGIPSGASVKDTLTGIFGEVLALQDVADEDNFFDLGGDSFAVIEMAAQAEARGLKISPALLVAHPTVNGLTESLALATGAGKHSDSAKVAAGGMSCRDLRDDIDKTVAALLGEGARAARGTGSTLDSPATVFLTGATGFLGSRVLGELLRRTEARIYCLVRAQSPQLARDRIRRALAVQGQSVSLANHERIVPLCGSIEQPDCALVKAEWNKLAAAVDTIYHCAANVNVVLPYEKLRPANFHGTLEVARLMRAGREKVLHYASTLSVFVATDRNAGLALESDTLAQTGWVYGGYAQTKWASEVLLRRLADVIGSVSHYRFGLITGDTTTGQSAANDFLSFFVRGITAIGCVPPIDESVAVDITPIDYAASAMSHLSLRQGQPQTYHIANPVSLRLGHLLEIMRDEGADLPEVEAAEFVSRLNDASSSGAAEAAACLSLCRSLAGETSFDRLRAMDLFQATGITFDTTNTDAGLDGSGLRCPPPTRELIRCYLARELSEG